MRPGFVTNNRFLLAAALCAIVSDGADAFHEGGVAVCNGCHTMHNLRDGLPVDPDHPLGNPSLLILESPSDVCLSCHADRLGAVFGADPLVPPPEKGAGNFVFLLEDNINDAPDGASDPIGGDAAGHNVNAPSRGVAADGTYEHSPGGGYPSAMMGCTSCHDPHGTTNFRFLHGIGPVSGGAVLFHYPAPDAQGISLVAGEESNDHHVAYRRGVSNWCANCHESYLRAHESEGGFEHLTRIRLDPSIVQRYNAYNGTDDPTGGSQTTAYLASVPFEDAAMTPTSTSGPNPSSMLMCLSCHRAHASSGPRSRRWDFNVSLLAEDGVVSGSYPIPDPYDSPTQGPLCEKCHVIPVE